MKDYQPKNTSKYWLPKAVYYQTLYAARDYDRLREEYTQLLHETHTRSDGQPRGTKRSDPTEKTVERLEETSNKLAAIEGALRGIPDEYRAGVFDNVRYQTPYPFTASRATWTRWRRYFICVLAYRLHLF